MLWDCLKDYDDIRNSPQQTNWGKVQPGDIKYKDVNGDGIINGSDEVAIGATTKPNLIMVWYSAQWKASTQCTLPRSRQVFVLH